MDSIAPECTELKKAYETCFNSWYTNKFLKGDTTDECATLFKAYSQCIHKALKEKKLDVMIQEHLATTANNSTAGGEDKEKSN